MTTITINNNPYEIESLSEDVKAQLNMIQQVDIEIARLNARLAIAQTARMAYSKAIEELLPETSQAKDKEKSKSKH
ncbi:DUF6447 family protein [Polynucleobacter asymbioticus]|jgi:chromosome segregation ATPase|uniref:Uncharacterized protein n=1 Tax=Polynucleobacter asymbioticus TaxID=576611 RepID=A0AAC9IX48_9BURK|nr:hypothetical protein A4F89_01855 [Polynucleobacter asymbioticus]APC00452.1 hypothetical protein AOC25_01860 [Polynucleobacter asymbioticus]